MKRLDPCSALKEKTHTPQNHHQEPPAMHVEEIDRSLLKLDSHAERCKALAERPLDEDLTLTVPIESCAM